MSKSEASMTAYLISLFPGRLDRDRGVGGALMSAEIIQFIPPPNQSRDQTVFPPIAFRSAAQPDDLTMGSVDTSRCEHVWPDPCDSASSVAGPRRRIRAKNLPSIATSPAALKATPPKSLQSTTPPTPNIPIILQLPHITNVTTQTFVRP